MNETSKILIIDDDRDDEELARRLLGAALPQAELRTALDPLGFAAAITDPVIDVLIADPMLDWIDGEQSLRLFSAHHPETRVILFTGQPAEAFSALVAEVGALAVVQKSSAGYLRLTELAARALSDRRPPPRPLAAGELVLFEHVPAPLLRVDGAGNIIEINAAATAFFGERSKGLVGQPVAGLLDLEEGPLPLEALLAGELDHLEQDVLIPRPTGMPFSGQLGLWPETTSNSVLGILSPPADTTAAEPSAQGAEGGNEEQFIYAVSHDLQEPIQLVNRYADSLGGVCEGLLDEEGRRFLGYLRENAQRAQGMLDDLLEYSRLGRESGSSEPQETDQVLDEVLQLFDEQLREIGARVVRSPLPPLAIDRGQLFHVFQNLIGNAIKFRSERPLEITITSRDCGEHHCIIIRDNGIGFEMSQSERIFGMFQRLHSEQEYPGTGIGLALSKRIVERHGGRIWARSAPGRGAKFYIALSKAGEE